MAVSERLVGGEALGATAVGATAVGWTSRSVAMALMAAVLLSPASWAADDPMVSLKIARVQPAQPASPFTLTALDGRTIHWKDLSGKVVLINFWATWCGPCKDEMPAFERLRTQLDPNGFALVTVTTDLQREGIGQFLSGLDVHLPVLFDEDHDVSQAYRVRALPTTVLIDRAGSVVGRAVGPRAWDSPEAVTLLRQLME